MVECAVGQRDGSGQQPGPAQQLEVPSPRQTLGMSQGHEQYPAVHAPPEGHAQPHEPQCCGFVSGSTQSAPQTSGASAGHSHVPETHAASVGQGRAHEPQFCASVSGFTHRDPQTSGASAGHSQTPASHTSFSSGHACPHAASPSPQFRGSVRPSTQRGTWAGQYEKAPQSQIPPEQVPAPQETPQPPQLAGSVA